MRDARRARSARSRPSCAAWVAEQGAGLEARRFRHGRTCATWASPTRSRCRRSCWLGPAAHAPCSPPSTRAHERVFGHADPHAPVEMVNLRVQLAAAAPRAAGGGGRAARAPCRRARGGSGSTAGPSTRACSSAPPRPRRSFRRPRHRRAAGHDRARPGGDVADVDRFGNLLVTGGVMRLDALTLELLRNYLHGAVEDMAYAVERTAHTTFVKETADFTCGLSTRAASSSPTRSSSAWPAWRGIDYARDARGGGALGPGDVVITNDPYGSRGRRHASARPAPVCPIFWEGRLVGHGAGFLHCSDIGGLVPASISPRAAEIFQEGLRLPPKKLFVAGAVNQDLLDVILANCRIPEQNWGDLQALVAGLVTGERRVHALIAALRARRRPEGHGRPHRLHRAEGRGAHPPDAARDLRVLRLHRGRRRHRHSHPAQGRDDGRGRRDPSGLHGQRRPGGLGAQRADGRAGASVHGRRAVQLLRHARTRASR